MAGLGVAGSVHHVKLSHSAARHVRVSLLGTPIPSLSAMSLSVAGTASLLDPLCGSCSSVCDRFTLGGPLIMRGCAAPHPTAKAVELDYSTPSLPVTAVSHTVLQVRALRHRTSLCRLQRCCCNHNRQIERVGRHGSLVSAATLLLPPAFAEAVSLTGCAGRWRCG
jgi:hypothetical protein